MNTFEAVTQSEGFRRFLLFSLVGITTLFALGLLTMVFQKDGITVLELTMLILYAILFTWICFSFWTAMFGFIICLFRRDRFAISASLPADDNIAPSSKTAIIMPIYNEDPRRVFAGLTSICESLLTTNKYDCFEVFIISDTRDPDIWIEEEMRWQILQQAMQGKINVYYRNREKNSERKVGNIKDFCQRWGAHYPFMIILDADSIMSGETLVKMVRLMEKNQHVALLQVSPLPINKESLFARIQQFASNVYNPIFTAGLNFWQLNEGNYWGHNSILRVKAFMDHCGLPRLPGKEPFGGDIFSHDFIEAAMLRRAGWDVWLAYDIGGSYEEIPPTLIDYAKRDRRWCQGNLQHTRILFAKGLHPINRLHLLMGIMSYLASPLWLLFLIVTAIDAYFRAQTEPIYFFGDTLFPVWPVSYTIEMATVLAFTLTFLFLPKILSLLIITTRKGLLKQYGGLAKLSLSVVIETLFSTLLAPIMMLFQSRFVLAILLRSNITWMTQKRDDHHTNFLEALSAHTSHTIIGVVAGWLSYNYMETFFWWFTPVLAGLVLSIPLSMLLSHVSLGRLARRYGLFLTPEETDPTYVVQRLKVNETLPDPLVTTYPSRFVQVLVDPYVNALHTALLPETQTYETGKRYQHELQGLIYKLLEDGIHSLTQDEKRKLLTSRNTLLKLHTMVWSLPNIADSLGNTRVADMP
ncbi:glucans biosynthesis glucosyltransferase MdoH [Beggiatoa leptomitoformis]|uniref:Glucans biosynthesis glucosyltransferase H n=1 Tax=Beggiatoa leptomitoformis TaxID=288004 RepID=A0A2N9YA22_9GAMM|nr:glucans biosynthesis glucosyltransferase MdoH [Beggiatoa leptomitoformis]ALG67263.1 glucans biosynthesis glucosyltransferase MdoH [Beggiatoa leptomitoformis]AUI67313.1 glucans biosynthesis glucosyltransferase MdoH [Beggiatoa leptomitoformis]